jgi:hypothetical protein
MLKQLLEYFGLRRKYLDYKPYRQHDKEFNPIR